MSFLSVFLKNLFGLNTAPTSYPLGIGVNVWPYTLSELDKEAIIDLGVKFIRVSLEPSILTAQYGTIPTPENIRWAEIDALHAWADIHHITILFITPYAFAANTQRTSLYDATVLENIANFVGAAASRYPLVWWELGNEPDETVGGVKLSVPAYMQYVGKVSSAIRKVNPKATIVSAGVNHDTYLAECVNNGMLQYVDYIGWHAYTSPSPSRAYGKPVIMTEYGKNCEPILQSGIISNMLGACLNKGAHAYFHFLLDDAAGTQNDGSMYGLIDGKGNRKPSFNVLKTWCKKK